MLQVPFVKWSSRNRVVSFEHMKQIEKGYKLLAKGNNIKGGIDKSFCVEFPILYMFISGINCILIKKKLFKVFC